jgi:hypothetical protein
VVNRNRNAKSRIAEQLQKTPDEISQSDNLSQWIECAKELAWQIEDPFIRRGVLKDLGFL